MHFRSYTSAGGIRCAYKRRERSRGHEAHSRCNLRNESLELVRDADPETAIMIISHKVNILATSRSSDDPPEEHLLALETVIAGQIARMALHPPFQIVDLEPCAHRKLGTLSTAHQGACTHPQARMQQQHRTEAERPYIVRFQRHPSLYESLTRSEQCELYTRREV